MFLLDLSEGLAIKQIFGKTPRSRRLLFLKQEGPVLGSLAVHAENRGRVGERGDTCFPLGPLQSPMAALQSRVSPRGI